MNRSVALLSLLLASTGCAGAARSASTGTAAPAADKSAVASTAKPKVICRTEKPIGSNIARTVCRSPEEIEAERQATQDAIHNAPKSGVSPPIN